MSQQPASRRYEQVLAAAMEKPWAILPAKLALIAEVIALRISDRRFTDEEIDARIGAKPKRSGTQTGSVQVIPVYGSIIPRGSSFNDVSGGQATSMEEFIQVLDQAAADSNVTSILLDIDSPGGQVDMLPEAAAAMRRARNQKPVVAVANTMAASAAYWLGSQASELVITPSGEVGSIGVFALHNDLSKQLEMVGITPTIIKAGKYKTELSPLQPLSEEAQAAAQANVDTYYNMFVRDVALGRGVPVNEVRGGFGEGRMVVAKEAVQKGMADRVDTFDNTLARLMRSTGATATRAEGQEAAFYVDPAPVTSNATVTEISGGFFDGAVPMLAAAVPYNDTDVVDEPWDGPGQEAKLPNPVTAERAKQMYAWQDTGEEADPDQKGSYKFPHHQVSDSGQPGAANVNGVRNAMSRLPQADIPDGDRAGVESHLQKHLDKFNGESEASSEGALGSMPQDPLAALRLRSREAAASERETYLSLLRRMTR
jgi:capsid assembly protease